MDDNELIAKNKELHRKQEEIARQKALEASKSTPSGDFPEQGGENGQTDFQRCVAGLISKMQAEGPRLTDEAVEAREKEAADSEQEKRLKDSGIPGRYLAETFDTYNPRTDEDAQNVRLVRQFVEDSRGGYPGVLVLMGQVGTGKSHLGCACIHERAGLYVDIPTLEIEVECSRDFSAPENKLEVLKRYARASFLVIDEIGRATSPAAEKSILYYIQNARYNARLPTVWITNFGEKELSPYVGAALIDRIAEKRVRVEFTGTSYRREKR